MAVWESAARVEDLSTKYLPGVLGKRLNGFNLPYVTHSHIVLVCLQPLSWLRVGGLLFHSHSLLLALSRPVRFEVGHLGCVSGCMVPHCCHGLSCLGPAPSSPVFWKCLPPLSIIAAVIVCLKFTRGVLACTVHTLFSPLSASLFTYNIIQWSVFSIHILAITNSTVVLWWLNAQCSPPLTYSLSEVLCVTWSVLLSRSLGGKRLCCCSWGRRMSWSSDCRLNWWETYRSTTTMFEKTVWTFEFVCRLPLEIQITSIQ